MKMSKRLKIKIAVLVLAVAASLVGMGFLLSGMQESLSTASMREEMDQEVSQLKELLKDAKDENAQNKTTFDDIYKSKAQSVSFLAHNDTGFAETDAKMKEYQQLLGVDNIMIVRRDGTVAAKATDTKADFAHARFNYLRECLSTGQPSRAVEIELPEKDWLDRYYAAKIDDDTMVVIEQSPKELRDLVAETGSTESVLKDISIGQGGYIFSLSAQTYIIGYHPDKDLEGTDALDDGIKVSDLEDGNVTWMKINGQDMYCRVNLIDGTYYIMAVPGSELAASRAVTVGVVLFAFFAVMAAVAAYGVFVMREDERDGYKAEEYAHLGPLVYNRVIGKKAIVLSLVGFLAVVGVAFYMQTLFALSSQSLTNKDRAADIAETIKRTTNRADELTQQFSDRYLSKAEVAAYALDQNPALATKDKMQELADALMVQNVYRFDVNGNMVASNAPYEHFKISDDPKDQSYEFHKLLNGVDTLVQKPQTDEMSGEMRQYVGVATHDGRGYVNGFMQLGISSKRQEDLLASVKIDTVLKGVKVGTQGFAFAIDKKTGKMAYYPDEYIQGKKATEVGLMDKQVEGGYNDYLTIGGKTLYASSVETDDYYLYVAGPEGELMAERVPLTIATGIIAAVCMAVTFVLLTIDREKSIADDVAQAPAAGKGADGDPRMIDVAMPSGRTAKSESAASRWLNRSLDWDEKTPEQKLGTILKGFLGLFVFCVFLAVIFREQIFGTDSVFSYILGGAWERGMNIFAITAAVMTACVVFTVAALIEKVLQLLSEVLSARGETVCRLLISLTKYGAILGTLYWCLATVGVDTATLLASAGLLTLAISFGAKDLVTDLLCGLFIIFEGEFRVGDSITVGGNSGSVMEIGIRTTKIDDGSGNVVVLRNSAISNVINRTKLDSYASVDVNISLGEDLVYVENVLKRELPNVAKRLPVVIDGPFYKGVVNLTGSEITIRVVARCAERDRGALERSLKREMRLLLSRNNIAPYQQTIEHDEDERKTAAEHRQEKRELESADEFVKEQSESAKNLANEDGKTE